jgi:CheY-like chemotaxis protein
MVMPAMSGDEIVVKLKDNEATKNIPIIVLSASVEDNIAEKVSRMGISAFFVKTQIIPSALSKKVTELIGE